jgi:hypothetical protein
MAAQARVGDHVALRVEEHVRRRGERCDLAKIDEGLSAVRELHRHETAAAEIARGGVHHRERIANGDGGVDRVAAAREHVDADVRRVVLGGDDHAGLGGDRRARGGLRGPWDEREQGEKE